jgi:hypothetical protein
MKTMSHVTRRILAIAFVLGALAAAMCAGQDVPPGVHYKKATDEANQKAKVALERTLSGAGAPSVLLGNALAVGPILWNDLKADNGSLSKDSTPMTLFLSVPETVQAEGRGLRTQEQRDKFWALVLEKYPELRQGRVRPARANEIEFFWACIPFDIEEPFFAIETPDNVFIANFRFEKGAPVLFWFDRVDDLRKLKK